MIDPDSLFLEQCRRLDRWANTEDRYENHDDRIAWDRVTFREVVELAWKEISDRGLVI